MEQVQTQHQADVPPGEAGPPADPPREVTARVRGRAWTEPRVRLWWALAVAVLGVVLYVVVSQTAGWWKERSLLTRGVEVQAVITRATDRLNDITVPDKKMPPDSTCELEFEWQGRKHQVRGQLPEHMNLGQHVVTGPDHPITLHVDPADPDNWTDRTTSPPLLRRMIAGVSVGLPIIAVLLLLALLKRRGVLNVWRTGPASGALVVSTGQTPLAPRSRVVRCTPADSTDKRVFTVYLPARAGVPARGDVVWVVRPPERPEPAYAVAWFDAGR